MYKTLSSLPYINRADKVGMISVMALQTPKLRPMTVVSVPETAFGACLTGVRRWNLYQTYTSFFRHASDFSNGFRVRPPLHRVHDFMVHFMFLSGLMFYILQGLNGYDPHIMEVQALDRPVNQTVPLSQNPFMGFRTPFFSGQLIIYRPEVLSEEITVRGSDKVFVTHINTQNRVIRNQFWGLFFEDQIQKKLSIKRPDPERFFQFPVLFNKFL